MNASEGMAQASSDATAVLAPAARDQAVEIAAASQTWLNALADDGQTQDQANNAAVDAFQHTDAAAYLIDQNTEADARQTYTVSASLAGKVWSIAQEWGAFNLNQLLVFEERARAG